MDLNLQKKSYDGKKVVDALGRTLVLREPSWYDQYLLFSAMGEDSTNSGCLSAALPLLYITSIDDAVITIPSNKNDLMAGLRLIRKEGAEKVLETIAEEKSPEGEIKEIKK